jgi:hypothetical protein
MSYEQTIERRKQNEMNRRNVLLTNHYREFVKTTYANDQTNVYVESIDEYLFHVVIDMNYVRNDNSTYRNVDSIVVRFKTYSNDEFIELSKIYA